MNQISLILSSYAGMHISAEEAMTRLELLQQQTLSGDWTTEDLIALHQAQEVFDTHIEATDFSDEEDDLFLGFNPI